MGNQEAKIILKNKPMLTDPTLKQKLILGTLFAALIMITFAFTASPEAKSFNDVSDTYVTEALDQQDWNSCIQKVGSKWGGTCLNYGFSEAKYTVDLMNSCNEKVDLMSCVQREKRSLAVLLSNGYESKRHPSCVLRAVETEST